MTFLVLAISSRFVILKRKRGNNDKPYTIGLLWTSVQYYQLQTVSLGYQIGLECTKSTYVDFTFILLSHTLHIFPFISNPQRVVGLSLINS